MRRGCRRKNFRRGVVAVVPAAFGLVGNIEKLTRDLRSKTGAFVWSVLDALGIP